MTSTASQDGKKASCAVKFKRGAVYLVGELIDACGGAGKSELVSAAAAAAQRSRDDEGFHLTLLTKEEAAALVQQQSKEELVARIAKLVNIDELVDCGLGRAAAQGNKAFYKVVVCPSATLMRQELKLDRQDFHVTVGFQGGATTCSRLSCHWPVDCSGCVWR